jgi:hypothetical protein
MMRTWWSHWMSIWRLLPGRRSPLTLPARFPSRSPVGSRAGRKLALEILEDRTLLSFAAPAVFDLGSAVKAVAVGHLMGASAPLDVVTADVDGTVKVLLGNGDGTFQNPENISLGATPTGLAVGDLLHNGLDDIVVSNTNGTVSVLLSNGNGTFQSPETIAVGGFIKSVAVGDFLGNGLLDILAAKPDGTLSVLLTNSDGTFQNPINSQAGSRVTDAAVGDFNRDGKADVAVATPTGLTILTGNGDGTLSVLNQIDFGVDPEFGFQQSAETVAAVDLHGNGKLDLLVNNGLQVLFGNGDGTFQDVQASHVGGRNFVASDFTGDGKLDVASLNFVAPFNPPTLHLGVGNGDGTFHFGSITNTGVFADLLAAGDFRGIGRSDLVLVGSFSHLLTILPSNPDGTFATAPTAGSTTETVRLTPAATGDFRGIGRQDIVMSGFDGQNTGIERILFDNGDGTFTTGPTISLGRPVIPGSVVVGDFTGNGNLDIVVSAGFGKIEVILGNGDGTFQAPITAFTTDSNNSLGSLVVGDFNHDGRLDIALRLTVTTGQQPSFVTILEGNGDGTFTQTATISVGNFAFGGALAAADLRGTGNLDLITVSNPASGIQDVKVLFSNGNGTFQNPVTIFTGDRAVGLAVGNFVGNGRNDILVTKFDGTVNVLANNGNGTFQSPIVSQFGPFLGSPKVADLFGDGKLSLVSTAAGVVSVFRGNGDGTFQAPVDYLAGAGVHVPLVADLNGDGKPDLIIGNSLTQDASILLNTSAAPSTADPIATNITLAADLNSTVFGQRVTFTATVTSLSGTPTGTVSFFDGDRPLGEVAVDPNGQAALVLPLGVGVHSLTARFAGIAPFAGSTSDAVSETVSKADTMTSAAAEILCGTRVVFTVSAVPVAPGAGTPTGTVTIFVDGTTAVATAHLDAFGQVFFDIDVPAGAHSFTAVFNGDGNFNGSISTPIELTI